MASSTKVEGLTRHVLADEVAEAILHSAEASGLKKDDVLPPATKLAEELGVSRVIVRGALEKLAEAGSIKRGQGRQWVLRRNQNARPSKQQPRTGEVERSSLADQAAAAVLELVREQDLKEGDQLPSTRALAERFGVSVLVMREALADLGARGILHRRQGRESVVAAPSHELISSILSFRAYLDEIDVAEFQNCRAGLEINAAALAAGRGTADERRALLEPLVKGMRGAGARNEDAFSEYDLAFHMAIAKACGNRALGLLLASLNDLVRSSLMVTFRQVRSRAGRRGIQVAIENHERIARAIVAGDEQGAARAMEQHFAYVLEQF